MTLGAPGPLLLPELPAAPRGELRLPILIQGDAAFTPENGVRRGSGTAEDPFVLANWSILPSAHYAVSLQGTRAHAVIEDLDAPPFSFRCWVIRDGYIPPCERPVGIQLLDAENVTIRRVTLSGEEHTVHVVKARNVSLEHAVLGYRLGPVGLSGGIWLEDAHGVSVRNVTVPSGGIAVVVYRSTDVSLRHLALGATAGHLSQGLEIHHSARVVVEDAVIRASWLNPVFVARSDDVRLTRITTHATDQQWIPISNVTRFVLEESDLARQSLLFSNNLTDVTIARTRFEGGAVQVSRSLTRDDWRADGLRFCGNEFRNATGVAALVLRDVRNTTFAGNRILGAAGHALEIVGWDLALVGNEVAGNNGMSLYARSDATLRGNAFEGNTLVRPLVLSAAPGAPPVDAAENWWGHASGPAALGGSGEDVRNASWARGAPVLDPWLTQRPTLMDGCA